MIPINEATIVAHCEGNAWHWYWTQAQEDCIGFGTVDVVEK